MRDLLTAILVVSLIGSLGGCLVQTGDEFSEPEFGTERTCVTTIQCGDSEEQSEEVVCAVDWPETYGQMTKDLAVWANDACPPNDWNVLAHCPPTSVPKICTMN